MLISRALTGLVISVVVAGLSVPAQALPLEKFEQQLEVKCSKEDLCSRSVRSKSTLGNHTGIVVRGDSSMVSAIDLRNGLFRMHAAGERLIGLLLTWDGDTYPNQLSSSGLRCFNLKYDDGSAFVMKDFSIKGVCKEGEQGECSPFVIETRVYDSADPTGQTYSASILRVPSGRNPEDLNIPFSNFNRKGLRGSGRFGCAGAVSIQIKMDAYSDVTVQAGPIFTNSRDPLEVPKFTPTPEVPTAAPEVVVNSTPTATPTVTPTMTSAPADASRSDAGVGYNFPGRGGDEREPESVSAAMTPGVSQSELNSGPSLSVPVVERVIVAPLNTPVRQRRREPEEVVYGEVVRQ